MQKITSEYFYNSVFNSVAEFFFKSLQIEETFVVKNDAYFA